MADFNQVMLPKLEDLSMELYDEAKGREAAAQELCALLGCSLPKVQRLSLLGCNNLLTIAKSGLLHGFQDLVQLSVINSDLIEFVFDFEEMMGHKSAEHEETVLLDQLKKLYLSSLYNLKHIWRMLPRRTPVFQNLMIITVARCDNIRYLLTPTVTIMLSNLEEIELEYNKLMEAMIGGDENDVGEDFLLGRIVLPKLRSLTVEKLHSLINLCCCSPYLTLALPSLTNLKVCYCSSLEAVFDFEEMMTPETKLLHRLERLNLYYLPNLKHIWRMLPEETPIFRNLKEIHVSDCGSLRYLLTPTVANMLVHLEEIYLRDNSLMEAMIGTESSDGEGEEISTKTILLPKLKKLQMLELPNFKMIWFSSNVKIDVPSLTELVIEECPEMSKLCLAQLTAPQLKYENSGSSNEVVFGKFISSWLNKGED